MSESDNWLEDIHAEIVSLQMSVHIEARCKDDERLEYIAEQCEAQAEQLHELQNELEALVQEWREEADELIHEEENGYVKGRGGQLAQCSNELEKVFGDE